MFYTEIGKIIEAGLDRDKDKVINYAKLLAKKLEEDGDNGCLGGTSGRSGKSFGYCGN